MEKPVPVLLKKTLFPPILEQTNSVSAGTLGSEGRGVKQKQREREREDGNKADRNPPLLNCITRFKKEEL